MMEYRMDLLGWTAWYEDGRVYSSKCYEWNEIPRMGLVILKKYYHVFDSEGKKIRDEATEIDVFCEYIYGHQILTLSIDEFKDYKVLPRCIKFPVIPTEKQLEEFMQLAEQDQYEHTEQNNPLSEKQK